MKVINLWGAPGAGKSTTAAALFALMKSAGLRVELVTEFAKALTWAKRGAELTDQFYIFAKQLHRQRVLEGQVDFVITDSPLPLTLIYDQREPESYRDYVLEVFQTFDNVNIHINRVAPYEAEGRNQTEEEAEELAERIWRLAHSLDNDLIAVDGDDDAVNIIWQHARGQHKRPPVPSHPMNHLMALVYEGEIIKFFRSRRPFESITHP